MKCDYAIAVTDTENLTTFLIN